MVRFSGYEGNWPSVKNYKKKRNLFNNETHTIVNYSLPLAYMAANYLHLTSELGVFLVKKHLFPRYPSWLDQHE